MKKVELTLIDNKYFVRFCDNEQDHAIAKRDSDDCAIDKDAIESKLGVVNYVTDSEVDEKKEELFSQYLLTDEYQEDLEQTKMNYCYINDIFDHDLTHDDLCEIEEECMYNISIKREELYQEFLSKQDTDSKWHCNSDKIWQYISDFNNENDFLMSIIDILAASSKKTKLLKENGYKIVELVYQSPYYLVAKFDDHDDIEFNSNFDRFLSIAQEVKSYSDYYDVDESSLKFNNPAKVYFFVKDTTTIRNVILSMKGNYEMFDKLAKKS